MGKKIKCIAELEVSNILFAAATILFSEVVQSMMDVNPQQNRLGIFAVLLLAAFFLKMIYTNEITEILQSARKKVVESFFGRFQEEKETTRLAKLLESDVPLVVEFENNGIPTMLGEVFFLIGYFCLIMQKSAYFALAVLLMGIGQVILPIYFARKFSANYESVIELEEKIEKLYYIYISNFKKLWFFRNDYALNRLREVNMSYYEAGRKSEKTAHIYNALMNTLDVAAQFGMCFIGVLFIWKANMTLPTLLSMLVLTDQIFLKFQVGFEVVKEYRTYRIAKKRLEQYYGYEECNKDKPVDFEQIEIKQLHPRFLNYRINATMKKGEKWLVKGYNGAGKSTFVKMLMNLEKDYDGSILVDDKNIVDMDVSGLYFYVNQHLLDIDFDVQDLLGRYEKSKVQEMFKIFGLDETIMNKSFRELSTGQQKKVQLISAFLSQKPILVFDEPENSLDSATKDVFWHYLLKYRGSVLVISNSDEYRDWTGKVMDVCVKC